MLLQGNAVSTVLDARGTSLFIGGNSVSAAGGSGSVRVAGSGSELRVAGCATFIGIGIGPGSFGRLTVADGGAVNTTIVSIRRSGGSGS